MSTATLYEEARFTLSQMGEESTVTPKKGDDSYTVRAMLQKRAVRSDDHGRVDSAEFWMCAEDDAPRIGDAVSIGGLSWTFGPWPNGGELVRHTGGYRVLQVVRDRRPSLGGGF